MWEVWTILLLSFRHMIWEIICALPTKIILLGTCTCTFIHFWSSTSVQVFLVYFVCLYVFLHDKIDYILLRTESELITGKSQTEVLCIEQVIARSIHQGWGLQWFCYKYKCSYGESWDSSYDKKNKSQSRTNESQLNSPKSKMLGP